MPQSLTIPEHNRRAFQDNFEQVIQQETPKLASKVNIQNFDGKEKVFQDFNTSEFVAKGRLQKSTPVEPTTGARKMTKQPKKCQHIFDNFDAEFLGSLGLPDSESLQSMRSAYARMVDTEIAVAAAGTAYGGEDPYVTALTLPSAQQVAVNYVKSGDTPANSGLTPQKIIRACAILEENEIDPMEEECIIALNPKAKQDLMAYVETSPNDTWASMITAWLEGKEKKLFGLTPVLTNRLETNTTTDVDTILVYSKSRGIYVAPGALQTQMDFRADLDHALQISAYVNMAFMRRHDEAVVTIACDRSPA